MQSFRRRCGGHFYLLERPRTILFRLLLFCFVWFWCMHKIVARWRHNLLVSIWNMAMVRPARPKEIRARFGIRSVFRYSVYFMDSRVVFICARANEMVVRCFRVIKTYIFAHFSTHFFSPRMFASATVLPISNWTKQKKRRRKRV